jgi:hypothetical protein
MFRPSYQIPPTVIAVGVNYYAYKATNFSTQRARTAVVMQSSDGRIYNIPDSLVYKLPGGSSLNGDNTYMMSGFDYRARESGIIPVTSAGMANTKIGFARAPSLQLVGDPNYPNVSEGQVVDVISGWQSIATPDVPSDLPGGIPGNYAYIIG